MGLDVATSNFNVDLKTRGLVCPFFILAGPYPNSMTPSLHSINLPSKEVFLVRLLCVYLSHHGKV